MVSIYQAFVHGKKGTETENCKINRNQEMLNTDVNKQGPDSKSEEMKLSVQCACSHRLPEQLPPEIWWY